MARHLQVFSLLSRLCASSSAIPSASLKSCRFASRDGSKSWTGQSHAHGNRGSHRPKYSDEIYDGEQELQDDVEDKLQALLDEGRKRQKTVKYHIMRRQMTSSGPPERKLTWDAMEQIRYLKREQPEEWTVERLAEGFSVTRDVILRVLRSKFTPSEDRKAKQNAKVMAKYNQQALPSGAGTQQGKLKLPGGHTPAVLPSGSKEGALISVTGQAQTIKGKGSDPSGKSLISVTVPTTQLTKELSEDGTSVRSTANKGVPDTQHTEEDLEQEESWDGLVLTEEELEEFLEIDKPSPPAQIGNEFFDEEGNFLYRL
ncbi:neugrin [Kryptolebias marmoratus]|uniref:Neugrin n=1 Tax=Kryptolebias marmoratus TaxID=37003 RepID=A0A3Q3B3A6_KRYMA|nr:neugrin [Kryptolebias marmoratus]